MTLLDAAFGYARRGWCVFPLKPMSKEPATPHGFKDSTDDVDQICLWWLENPDYNIGIDTGESDLVVVDIDPRAGGFEAWAAIYPGSLDTTTVYTGGGGVHYYFEGAGKFKSKLADGVDIKSVGGYVVAPPSVHPDGGKYVTILDNLQPVPDWLAPMLVKPEREAVVVTETDSNDSRPGTRFIAETNWHDLMTGWGYTAAGVGVDGQQFWTRPGKTQGISAVTGGETDTLYVFSSSTAFEANKPYNRFSAYVHMEYGGDFKRAAEALADRYSIKVSGYREEVTVPEEGPAFRGGVPG